MPAPGIAAVLLIASASPASSSTSMVEPNPATMSQSEIRAFNARVGKDHEYYIRCKRSLQTGSFLKADMSCRTNAQWATAADRGNDKARDFVESTSKAWSRGN